MLPNCKAITKIKSLLLVAVVAAVMVSGAAYVLFSANLQTNQDPIRIGISADLDYSSGKAVWQAAILAAEQVNAEGGVLGRNLTVVAEDDDDMTSTDISAASNALIKLITVDGADYVISSAGQVGMVYSFQDICAEHKKIYFSVQAANDNFTRRVLENYDRYKYFFKLWAPNATTVGKGALGDILTAANYTGFTRVGFLGIDDPSPRLIASSLNSSLPKYGLSLVYSGFTPATTKDFTSYFSAVEAAETEILCTFIPTQASIPFVKEWCSRQSPCVIWGISLGMAGDSNYWSLTEGKCEYVSFSGVPVLSGYPLTNKTASTREAYFQRWGEVIPSAPAVAAYDGIRFILPDAIRRAGTTETEAVLKALETVNVETSMARHFVFTSSHDLMVGGTPNNPAEDHVLVAIFQWQANQRQVLIKPEELMKETGEAYLFPPWKGPWSE